MADAIEKRILDAIVAGIRAIDGPPIYRRTIAGDPRALVKAGVVAGDLAGPMRPLITVSIASDSETVQVMGKRHQVELELVVYLETADVEDPEGELIERLDDLRLAIRRMELLPTADVPGGLLHSPMWTTGSRRVVDPSGGSGIGSAELEVHAIYRVAH